MAKKKMPPSQSTSPAVSIIIPMYNAEEYISECLESVLLQTFQDFEVIVVDDCSTDDSVKLVENYAPKFDGRFTLAKTEENSGGGGYIPRNIGLNLARGEYVFFIDADDFILLTALETLYSVAKEYGAEVVYTSSFYDLKTSNDVYMCQDGENIRLLKEDLEDKITLNINDQKRNLHWLMVERNGNLRGPWTKFVLRDFLIKNEIFFPEQMKTSGDFIWTIKLYCLTKKFLRLPNTPIYFYRRNFKSVTLMERTPSEQVAYLISVFVDFMKSLNVLRNTNEVLAENPDYCFAALKSHFEWFLKRTNESRSKLSSEDIYAILCREFAKDPSISSTVPFLFSFIDTNKKIGDKNSYLAKKSEKDIAQFKTSSFFPAISVIIPMYNAEKHIGKCLDSVLTQTFQNFEVIVVDDCSTDNSVDIVKNYMPKFNGHLKLSKTEKNSGGGAVPRNKGLLISCGEYIQFLDADDMLTQTALAEMYSLAKEHDADVVYCEKYYEADADGTNIQIKFQQNGKLVDKPTMDTTDLQKRVQEIIDQRFSGMICNKFVKRSLIMEHKIFLPNVKTSEDNIWTQGLIFYAKNILRVPNAIYIYCQTKDSSQRLERNAQQKIIFWLNPVLLGLKALNNLMSRNDFFLTNPSQCYAILKEFICMRYNFTLTSAKTLDEDAIYSTIKDTFGEKLGEYDVLISALCTNLYTMYNEKKAYADSKILCEYINYLVSDTTPQPFEARIDIKFFFRGEGDFSIISVSDNKAEVVKPPWFQEGGIGYKIQSRDSKLELIAKSTVEGRLSFNFKGIAVWDPNNKDKRIPKWIGYTIFAVNGNTIFDTLTPAWHDKPYTYKMAVKANEEIRIQVEWLQHKSNTVEPKVVTPPPKVIAPEPKVKPPKIESSIPRKFNPLTTARIDAKFVSTKGDFQILSVSDTKASVSKPNWFQRNGIGYVIQSSDGKLTFVAKATADGKINLNLRGMDVRNSEDWSNGIAKRIPYWIDYTKLTVNGKNIFNTRISSWCDKPYACIVEAKANEEIKIQVEWQPHKSDPNDDA